jgi:bla regulator protein blaR1
VVPLALAGLAVLLVWVTPGLLARQLPFRRAPRAALVAWQSVSLGGMLAAVFVAPAAVLVLAGRDGIARHPGLVTVGAVVSGAVLLRVLVSGHLVGTRVRAARARHRDLVDIVAEHERDGLRVLQHPTATAYCIPGRSSRVVLSQGVLDTLPPPELAAVLAHEKAHLRARHDLLLEFFTVLHESVPSALRSRRAMAEVRLLVEALADRAAVRTSGEVATARALVAIAESRSPDAAMGAGTSAPVRMQLLAAGPRPELAVIAYGIALTALLAPLGLLSLVLG